MFPNKFYIVIFCSALALISCKKNNAAADNAGIDSSKAVSLSEKIVLHHGTRLEGAMPLPSDNGPSISTSDNRNTIALAGRYAAIKPEIISGEIAGYLLRIAGDSTAYFKIDFSMPSLSGRKKVEIRPVGFGANFKRRGSGKVMDDPDYNDSLIIINLPEDMKPGILCVEYIGYDGNNNYGNIVKSCVAIEAPGGDVRFSGKWKLNRIMSNDSIDGNTGWTDPYIPSNISVRTFSCIAGQLKDYLQFPNGQPDTVVENDIRLVKYEMSFLSNGSFSGDFNSTERWLKLDSSTCSKLVYDINEDIESYDGGGWSYNATIKKMVLLFYEDRQGTDMLDFAEWNIEEMQENKFVVYFPADQDTYYEEWWEFIKAG